MNDDTTESARESAPDDDIASVTLTTLSDSVDTALPEVQQHAVDAARREAAEAIEQVEKVQRSQPDLVDRHGNPFDPDQHVTDETGQPKLTKTGKLRMKTGRKSGGSSGRLRSGQSAEAKAAAETAQKRAATIATGKMMAAATIQLGVTFGGDEWMPVKQPDYDERQHLEMAFAEYCEAKDMDDLPAGVVLCIALGSYAVPRFTKPVTQSRMSLAWAWIKNKMSRAKKDKKDKPTKGENDESRTNTRND